VIFTRTAAAMVEEMSQDTSKRFAFGKNWANFLKHLNEDRIKEAEKSLQEKLACERLDGKTFLDIGSGSGLFSLAAHRLGAKVMSFDYDQDSVNCTQYLCEHYGSKDADWSVEQGSVLDQEFLKRFGQVDVLYSWGVLHHTGNMMKAFENVSSLVKDGGQLFISIYNDQGGASKRWTWIKRKYNHSGRLVRFGIEVYTFFRCWTISMFKDFLKSGNPFKSLMSYGKDNRGMKLWCDLIDWVGGYPFEVAKPEVVFDFFVAHGFQLKKLKTCRSFSCNEFVFVRE
jgi:2-polyprenyl-3-methyl-5-hydroxy-6-metoxy-1,4-benzoquinol methylase